jgi:hypothetical protein
MSQPHKLILKWDINPETEADYFEFMVSDFIPAINRLGIDDIQAWYTMYGKCEQILFSGIADSEEQMLNILGSDSWENLIEKLEDLVSNFEKKVISNASGGFQL